MVENKIIDLNYLSVLKVSGQGAFELLQGQITCDLNKINSTTSCLGALCNVKGRVISSFIVTSSNKEEFVLIGPSEMLTRTEKELNKYSPFYKVKLEENTSNLFYGIKKSLFKELYSKDIPSDENTFKIKDILFINYLDKEYLLSICDASNSSSLLSKVGIEDNINKWIVDEMACLNVEITEENTEKYTPHELNYDITNRIDFDKGCYTGQEVVARMHYRAKTFPRLNLAESNSMQLKPNMVVCDENNTKVGSLVKVIKLSNKSICLISIKEKKLDSPLRIRETDSALNLDPGLKFPK